MSEGKPHRDKGADAADGLVLLGRAFEFQQSGRLDEAESIYARVLEAAPDELTALINGGALALARGKASLAVARLERAVRLAPRNAVALTNLGLALIHAERDDAALVALDRAIALAPNSAQAHNHRGIALARLARPAEAIAAFERTLALDPRHAEAALNLGARCNDAGDGTRARTAFARVLAHRPDDRNAQIGHAFARAQEGDLDGAIRALETIVANLPGDAVAWQTLAAVRNWAWAHEPAADAFRRAQALDPGDNDSAFGIASTLLARGRFAEGWAAFERRPDRSLESGPALSGLPVWDGAPFDGTLVVHGEQGFGDVIQFARFVPAARARSRRLILLLDGYHAPLAPLLATLDGADAVVTSAADIAVDASTRRVSILSLPHRLAIASENLAAARYLAPPAERSTRWLARLGTASGPRIGIAWSVAARDVHAYATRHKSVPVEILVPLLESSGAAFFTLQPGAAGAPSAFGRGQSQVHDLTAEIGDFADTAALVEAMDLVITPDTAVAHLAGALGKPVWMLDRFNSCWRWRLAAESSPWYSSMRIFRQSSFGDWSSVGPPLAAAFADWRARL